ncbi:MAG: hypothetical protein ACJ77M_16720 [Thermoleophilaceae bacterium]
MGMRAFGDSQYAGEEPHYLLIAKAIDDRGSPDLAPEYRARSYKSFYPYPLDPHGELTKGHLNEPHGVGFPLIVSGAYAIGGPKLVELEIALLAAIAMALAYRLALRCAPDPWALGATLAVALSAPALAYGTAVLPEMAAAPVLAGAALLALHAAERARRRNTLGCFGLLATLPWLGPQFIPAGIVIGWFAFRSVRRFARPILALVGVEVAAFSLALYAGVNRGLYGGLTPLSAAEQGASGTLPSFPDGYLHRAYRLIALLIDRDYGLLRWAPVLAIAIFGAVLVMREREQGLARAIPALRREQDAAELCGLALAAQYLVAAFAAVTMFGFWFPGRHVVAALPLAVPLVAIGLRHAPRVGAVLAAIGLAGSVWLYADVRFGSGGFVANRPDAPFGPLNDLLPVFKQGSTFPFVVAAGIGALLAALLATERRLWRRAVDYVRLR